MKCERCKKNEATIIAIQISNGVPHEIHICEECAYESESGSQSFAIPMSFQDFFQGILNIIGLQSENDYYREGIENKELNCKNCGMTYNEFKSTGRLGCENCYKTFKGLDTVLKNMQGSNHHIGKIPNRGKKELFTKRELYILRQQLTEAIKIEEYEDAAKLRDKIRAIEKEE